MAWLQSFSGVRSCFGEGPGITHAQREFAARYGYCYAHPRIASYRGEIALFIVARDPRPTGDAIAAAQMAGFAAAAQSLGRDIDVLDLGILTTPMFQHAVRMLDACGGVMITASHNPLTDNGWKYATSSPDACRGIESAPPGALLSAPDMGALIDTVADCTETIADTAPSPYVDRDARARVIADYELHIAETFRLDGNAPKIVLDPNGGAACTIAADLLRHLGIDVIEVHGELGRPEHEIDTDGLSPASGEHRLAPLSRLVAKEGALCGIAFDYDADRGNLALPAAGDDINVPEPQVVAAANMALALAIHRRLHPDGGKLAVVVSDSTSARSADIAHALGADVYEAETGEINVTMKMRDLEAEGYAVPVAVEGGNGGTIFRGSTCRDGILVAAAACQVAEDPTIIDDLAIALGVPGLRLPRGRFCPSIIDDLGIALGSGARGSSRATAASPLQQLFDILPHYATRAAKVDAAAIPALDLKAQLERRFVEDHWPTMRAEFTSYEIIHYQAMRVGQELTGDGSGGWKRSGSATPAPNSASSASSPTPSTPPSPTAFSRWARRCCRRGRMGADALCPRSYHTHCGCTVHRSRTTPIRPAFPVHGLRSSVYGLHIPQRLIEIGDDVLSILAAHRDADQSIGDSGFGTFLRRAVRITGRRRMDHESVNLTQTRRHHA